VEYYGKGLLTTENELCRMVIDSFKNKASIQFNLFDLLLQFLPVVFN